MQANKDYCTFWPDNLFEIDWSTCCKVHDIAYEFGLPRLDADWQLGLCVANLGAPIMGALMTVGVFIFGWVAYARANQKRSK